MPAATATSGCPISTSSGRVSAQCTTARPAPLRIRPRWCSARSSATSDGLVSCRRVQHRIDRLLPCQPACSVVVYLLLRPWLSGLQLKPGVFGEEGVDPEPVALFEARHEEALPDEFLHHPSRAGAVQRRIAERGRELAQYREPLQEHTALVVEGSQDLAAQVVRDEALLAAESRHSRRGVIDAAQPDPAEHEHGRPALRPLDQGGDLVRREVQAEVLDEQGAGLGHRERQVTVRAPRSVADPRASAGSPEAGPPWCR